MQERRQYDRFGLDCVVNVSTPLCRFETELLDVSFRGALISLPKHYRSMLAPSSAVEASMELTRDVLIHMTGHVAHHGFNTFGLYCTGLDLVSASRLKRFVEVNMGVTELLDRELNTML